MTMTLKPEAPKTIKLIAIDIDGTLLNPKSELSPRVERAVRAAMEKGVKVVLATGKTINATQWLREKLNFRAPIIAVQGLVTYDENASISTQQTIDPMIARRVITYMEERGFTVIGYSGQRMMMRAVNEAVAQAYFTHYHEPKPEIVGALQNKIDTVPFNKIIAVGEPKRITALRWQLNAILNGAARVMQAGVPEMLEILPAGGSKGAALRALIKEMRLNADEVMAIGDAENDMEMLQFAGFSAAMGQASQRVQESADIVVASNEFDGAAEAIERALGLTFAPPASAEPEGDGDGVASPPASAAPTDGTAPTPSAPTPAEQFEASAAMIPGEAARGAQPSDATPFSTPAPALKVETPAAPSGTPDAMKLPSSAAPAATGTASAVKPYTAATRPVPKPSAPAKAAKSASPPPPWEDDDDDEPDEDE